MFGLTTKQLKGFLQVRAAVTVCKSVNKCLRFVTHYNVGGNTQRVFVRRLLQAIAKELKSGGRGRGGAAAAAGDDGAAALYDGIDTDAATDVVSFRYYSYVRCPSEIGKGVSVSRFGETAQPGKEAGEQDEDAGAEAAKPAKTKSGEDDGKPGQGIAGCGHLQYHSQPWLPRS